MFLLSEIKRKLCRPSICSQAEPGAVYLVKFFFSIFNWKADKYTELQFPIDIWHFFHYDSSELRGTFSYLVAWSSEPRDYVQTSSLGLCLHLESVVWKKLQGGTNEALHLYIYTSLMLHVKTLFSEQICKGGKETSFLPP